jgi:hypothetical protein
VWTVRLVPPQQLEDPELSKVPESLDRHLLLLRLSADRLEMSGEARRCYDVFFPLPLLALARSAGDRSIFAP